MEPSLPQYPTVPQFTGWSDFDFRRDLAFPSLSEEMIERIRPYGAPENLTADALLYGLGASEVDMFVIVTGSVNILVPQPDGSRKLYVQLAASSFTGEFNLLNSQRSIVELRTGEDSSLLRISREQFRRLMRAEGDIANIIVSAAIWRRIGILRAAAAGVVVTGAVNDAQLTLLQRFLVRNNYPHKIVELTSPEVEHLNGAGNTLPSVQLSDGRVLSQPAISALADELGIAELPNSTTVYDVVVVGAGPSGLAAAVYAASEGLCTLAIESLAAGGQAGTSSKIENYLGFPTGIDGQQLASRAELQALKFGVHFSISREAVTLEQVDGLHKLTLAGGCPVHARAVVVATGAQYRRLTVPNYERYENRGLYYAATPMESLLCRESEVIVVGGGNSAGQASVFLSRIAKHVYHIVRGPSLASTMSQYLISRIESSTHITLCSHCEITALQGDRGLESVTWVNRKTGERMEKPIRNVFVMIGAEPNTGWLYGSVRLDKKGFILTGGTDAFEPTPYATSVPGIFAVGDVRSNSVKRVASAVGEGSVVISYIHQYLADHHSEVEAPPDSALAALRAANTAAGEHRQSA